MPDVTLNNLTHRQTWTSYDYLWQGGIGLPQGRVMHNGRRHCAITALYGYASGNGGQRSIELQLGSAKTGDFLVGASNQAQDTGWKGTNWWLVEGGNAVWSINNIEAALWFGRGSSGTVHTGNAWNGASAQSWSGGLAGAYRYVESPSNPELVHLVHEGMGRVYVGFRAPASDGGTGLTGYRAWYWKDGEGTDARAVDVNGIFYLNNLELNTWWNVRISAKNWVTANAGTYGPPSNFMRVYTDANGRVWAGSAWAAAKPKVYDAGWKDAQFRVFDGDSWELGR